MTFAETHSATERRPTALAARGDVDRFVSELTRLSRECRIGIAGSPTLYVVEPEDLGFAYVCDEDSQLVLR